MFKLRNKVKQLNRIEVRHEWQVAMLSQHGYYAKRYGNRIYMQRTFH